MRKGTLALLAAVVCAATAAGIEGVAGGQPSGHPPNVVFILTDDQTLAEMTALPKTTTLIGSAGATFDRAYISYPLCCPSRATLLTGEYMHNTNVRGNEPPVGGWGAFTGHGLEARALPVWLDNSGYATVHAGKYLNGYPVSGPPVPPGWDEWYGKLSQYDPSAFGNEIYFNYELLEKGPDSPTATVRSYGGAESDYQTDVVADKAIDAIHRYGGPGSSKPFFINVWFSAPHSPYLAAQKYAAAFDAAPVPRGVAVDERNMRDKPKFMRRLHPLRKRQIGFIRERQRNRWAQLLSVDDAVENIYQALAQEDRLSDTYVIFMSDNGYFSGEHRIAQGKYLPYEPSSHVPLLIRGPGIPAGSHSSELVSNADIAPTIAEVAGASPELTVDGRSLLPFAQNPSLRSSRPILLEGDTGSGLTGDDASEASLRSARARRKSGRLHGKKGVGNLEQEPIPRISRSVSAPAYRAIRTDRYLFVRYAGNTGTELYDMQLDPQQVSSRSRDPRYRLVKAWLAQKLSMLETCAGASCRINLGPEPLPLKHAPRKSKKKGPGKGKGKGRKPSKGKGGKPSGSKGGGRKGKS